MRGSGCHIIYLGIKREWRKGADRMSNKREQERAAPVKMFGLQWSDNGTCLLALQTNFLILCLLVSSPRLSPLSVHIPYLSVSSLCTSDTSYSSSQHEFTTARHRRSAIHFNHGPRKAFKMDNFVSGPFENAVLTPSILDEWMCSKDLILTIWKLTGRNNINHVVSIEDMIFCLDQ